MDTKDPIRLDDSEQFTVIRGGQQTKVPFVELSREEIKAIYARSVDKVVKGIPMKGRRKS